MKTFASFVCLACTLFFTNFADAVTNAAVELTAKDKASGKVVYKGETNAAGKFSTSALAPGTYTFQFTAKDGAGFQVALSGAKSAKQIKGPKSSVTFAVEMASTNKVSGRVTATPATAATGGKNDPNVKIVNGKRYVFVRGEIGSNMGGKWIPEEEARKSDPNRDRRNATEATQRIQDLGSQ